MANQKGVTLIWQKINPDVGAIG